MISLDTNVLIRILVDDPDNSKQNIAARTLAKKYKHFFISQIVQVELIWVLERAYKFKKPTIKKVLRELIDNTCFILQRNDNLEQALDLYGTVQANFSDCLIYVESISHDAKSIMTFDKIFSKIPKVNII